MDEASKRSEKRRRTRHCLLGICLLSMARNIIGHPPRRLTNGKMISEKLGLWGLILFASGPIGGGMREALEYSHGMIRIFSFIWLKNTN